VTITVTADPDGLITEANEENNQLSIEKTVVHNGYRGKRWTDGGDIATAVTYDVRGDLVYSSGNSTYLSASTYPNWTDYVVTWTAGDLAVPAGATIAGARLYVPYTWDKGPVFPEDVTLTFNGEAVEREAFYEDEKMWGSSYPYGMTVYDVTDVFNAEDNTALLTNTFPGGGNVSIRGMLLAVVYDDGTTAPHTVIMNEGFDLLYGGEAQGTTPEQATAYAPFFGVETDDVLSATLVTVAPGAGPTKGDLLFNDQTWTRVWNYTGTTQVGVDERDVTAFLLTGENLVGFQSSADYMEAAAAFLVLEYPALPGSISVTSTPAGAAVWLDGTDTGEFTPTTLEDVPAGDHVVTLKLDGYADASRTVTVEEGETAEVDLELTTLTGSLTVTSTPEGAAIFIDGADTGEVTTATIDGIGVGTHTVTLKLAGYADAVAEVTIAENETATLHLDLIEAPGSIAVTSTPTGAAIFLDGVDTGKTTNALLENVPAGDHVVTVKLDGYADASTTVTVVDDRTVVASFTLTEPAGSIVVTSAPDGARIFLDGTDTGEVTDTHLENVPVGTHTVRVELDGYLEAEETVTVTSGATASVHFTLDASAITLQPGWNFVSTPKRLADGQNTIAIFDGVDTNGRPVLYYNGTSQWEDLSREDAFRPLDGIWIYANGTYEIPLSFAAASTSPPPTKYLDAGWNAIGFSDTFPEPAVTTLRSVETTWANLFGWKAREQAYDDSIIRGATGKHGEMRELSPFQGYWLYMNNADTLAAIGA
ncbi:MAG: PEGA domain-containing protein, partial [Methanoculleus sp.]